jgi:hypothetical protein
MTNAIKVLLQMTCGFLQLESTLEGGNKKLYGVDAKLI